MPVTTNVDTVRGIIVHGIEGEIGPGDFATAIGERLQNPDFRPGLNVLWDFTNAPEGSMASRDLRRLMESARDSQNSATKVAVVTTHQNHHAMATSIAGMSGELPMDVKAFQNTEEALAWLCERGADLTTPLPDK